MKLWHILFDTLKKLWYNDSHIEKEELMNLYSALDVARYVVNYANDNDMIVSNLKLQKILYFVQLQFLINNAKRPCFDDDIEAWAFGPVVPEVYREFKRYGSLSIPPVTEYYDLSNGYWNLEKKTYKTKIAEPDQRVINSVVNICNNHSASDLVSITHRQSPWMDAYGKKNPIISKESMIDFIDKHIKDENR